MMLRTLWMAGLCIALYSASFASADEPNPSNAKKSPSAATGLCKKVGESGVGESGSHSFLYHKVTGNREIVMVVRNTESSLCADTGAVAMLLVNGELAAQGIITKNKSIIQANAKPGDNVVAIVDAFPLYNDVNCIRLGELQFSLEQCDLE